MRTVFAVRILDAHAQKSRSLLVVLDLGRVFQSPIKVTQG